MKTINQFGIEMISFTDLEAQTIITKGIQLERDCKALLAGDFDLLYPVFGKRFYGVFGDSGPKLLRYLEHFKIYFRFEPLNLVFFS